LYYNKCRRRQTMVCRLLEHLLEYQKLLEIMG